VPQTRSPSSPRRRFVVGCSLQAWSSGHPSSSGGRWDRDSQRRHEQHRCADRPELQRLQRSPGHPGSAHPLKRLGVWVRRLGNRAGPLVRVAAPVLRKARGARGRCHFAQLAPRAGPVIPSAANRHRQATIVVGTEEVALRLDGRGAFAGVRGAQLDGIGLSFHVLRNTRPWTSHSRCAQASRG
jgi:hypothetical protein